VAVFFHHRLNNVKIVPHSLVGGSGSAWICSKAFLHCIPNVLWFWGSWAKRKVGNHNVDLALLQSL
jgi:hypothetical protein